MSIIPNSALFIVLQEIEEEDIVWQAKSRKSQKLSPEDSISEGAGAGSGLAGYSEAENTDEQQRIRATRQPQSARDYGA